MVQVSQGGRKGIAIVRAKKIVAFLFLLNVMTFPIHQALSTEIARITALPQFISDTYQEDNILISYNRAYCKTDNYGSTFCIELNVKVLAENKIIRPSKYAYGIYVLDNFGNDLNVISMAPRFCESLRPREEKLFIITFSIKPLDNTKYLLLQMPKGIFGNINSFELKIYNTGFKGAITKEERERMESGIGFGNLQNENAYIDFKPVDFGQKKRNVILYAAIFVGLFGSCSLGMILIYYFKNVKKTILGDEPFLIFFAHWLNQNSLHLLIFYLLATLISLVWLIIGIIIVMTGCIGTTDDIFWIAAFLASWGLLSFLSFCTICEKLNKWRALNNDN
jgi:hypothetical protein